MAAPTSVGLAKRCGVQLAVILSSAMIGEVKDVRYQAYTSQLRDFAAYSQKYGYEFPLYVRQASKLSVPLQDAVNGGVIRLIRNLP